MVLFLSLGVKLRIIIVPRMRGSVTWPSSWGISRTRVFLSTGNSRAGCSPIWLLLVSSLGERGKPCPSLCETLPEVSWRCPPCLFPQ